jgi:hypothetical protein
MLSSDATHSSSSPVFSFSYNGHVQTVEYLVRLGCNPDLPDNVGFKGKRKGREKKSLVCICRSFLLFRTHAHMLVAGEPHCVVFCRFVAVLDIVIPCRLTRFVCLALAENNWVGTVVALLRHGVRTDLLSSVRLPHQGHMTVLFLFIFFFTFLFTGSWFFFVLQPWRWTAYRRAEVRGHTEVCMILKRVGHQRAMLQIILCSRRRRGVLPRLPNGLWLVGWLACGEFAVWVARAAPSLPPPTQGSFTPFLVTLPICHLFQVHGV